jgi:hypothetical protein
MKAYIRVIVYLQKRKKIWVMVLGAMALAMCVSLALVIGFSKANEVTPPKYGYGPTGAKTQSKLWFNDGAWWGVFLDRSSEEYHIFRYDWDTGAWSDSATLVDERNPAQADVLWDGTHLYIASAGPDGSSENDGARFLRYSYDSSAESYSLDLGFPKTVSSAGTEAIVLAKDTSDKLWATYTQNAHVYVTHSLDDDLSWAEPFVLPVQQGTTVNPDDVSSIVAFDSQVGVMWTNQADDATDDAVYFATHKDGDPDDVWQESVALKGVGLANDHINLKTDSTGRLFAAVKARRDRIDRDLDAPHILLLVRDPSEGSWTSHVFGRVRENHTRPLLLLDEEHRDLYVFATSPCCQGGKIYYKRTSMDDVSFEEGLGTLFLENTSYNMLINDATSTKQTLDSTTGILVEASDKSDGYYHNVIDLTHRVPGAPANDDL